MDEMKVALCAIGRLENQYAVEFVEWYKNLGFDKIFIYDNNHDGEEYFEEVLQQFIDNEFVEIIPYRNVEKAQFSAYNECYAKHKNEYNWFAFFDFDEFLMLQKDDNIKLFLSRFSEDKQCILINWMIMDDNDLVHNNGKPLMERFTRQMSTSCKGAHPFPENDHVKSILRGGIDGIHFSDTPHSPNNDIVFCDAVGNICEYCYHKPCTFNGAYLKHFITKTIDEWLNNKMVRGTADREYDVFSWTYKIDDFFKFNERTKEKEEYIKRYESSIIRNR